MALQFVSDLNALIEKRDGPCVSIFMPTFREAVTAQQDPIRLKNLARKAEERLLEMGMRAPEARDLLGPVYQLVQQPGFWEPQTGGLAVFRASDVFETHRVPLELPERAVVSHRFDVKPLFPLMGPDGQFYILAMSQAGVKLLRASRFNVEPVELKNMPTSKAEALKDEQLAKTLQWHTNTPPPATGRGERPAMFHGQGSAADDAKADILQYFKQVDTGLHKILAAERTPMVFAGVEYLFPIYQEANSYQHLQDQVVAGNPQGKSDQELRDEAWKIVQPLFMKQQQEAAGRYQALAGTASPKSSDDVKEIALAAAHGRVDTLFAPINMEQWGKVDPDMNAVEIHPQAQPGDEELINFAAGQTYLNRGAVYVLDPTQIPGRAQIAAIFRY